jgi:VanZ family protein
VARDLGRSPLSILLFHSWNPVIDRFTIRDAIVNIALYLPLGMAGYLALSGPTRYGARYWAPIAGGLLLSSSIEMIQLFEPTRNTSALDVVTNFAGAVLGVVAGAAFEAVAGPMGQRTRGGRETDRAALSLAFLWAAYLVFPFFPLVGIFGPKQKVQVFLSAPVFAPLAVASAAAVWFAAGILLRAAALKQARLVLVLSILAIPLQIFIVDRQPVPSDLIGAALGIVLFLVVGRNSILRLVEAALFLAVVVLRGLAPFAWHEAHQAFNWIPFGGFLESPWQRALLTLIEKGFYYGTAIWLLRRAGMRLAWATALVAAVLAGIEAAQLHLPGRTAEITDPVLAILLGIGLASVGRATLVAPFQSQRRGQGRVS